MCCGSSPQSARWSETFSGNWLGYRWSEETLKRMIDRWGRILTFEWDEFTKGPAIFFRKYGDWIVFLLRFSPPAAHHCLAPCRPWHAWAVWRFSMFTFLGSLIWNGLLILGGRALSGLIEQYETAAGYAIVALVLAGVAVVCLSVFVTWKPVAAFENNEDD